MLNTSEQWGIPAGQWDILAECLSILAEQDSAGKEACNKAPLIHTAYQLRSMLLL